MKKIVGILQAYYIRVVAPELIGYTVATLPSGSIGKVCYITDCEVEPTYGYIPTGGGSFKAKVWHNGDNWVVG